MRIVPLTLPVLGSAAIAARGQALRRVSPVAARCCPASAKSRSPGRVEKPAQDLRPRFALLLYEDAGFRPGSHTELVAEYAAWADSLRGQGKLVMGAELDQAETVVLSGAGNAAPASPGEERSAIGILGGFFIVRVATRERHSRWRGNVRTSGTGAASYYAAWQTAERPRRGPRRRRARRGALHQSGSRGQRRAR